MLTTNVAAVKAATQTTSATMHLHLARHVRSQPQCIVVRGHPYSANDGIF